MVNPTRPWAQGMRLAHPAGQLSRPLGTRAAPCGISARSSGHIWPQLGSSKEAPRPRVPEGRHRIAQHTYKLTAAVATQLTSCPGNVPIDHERLRARHHYPEITAIDHRQTSLKTRRGLKRHGIKIRRSSFTKVPAHASRAYAGTSIHGSSRRDRPYARYLVPLPLPTTDTYPLASSPFNNFCTFVFPNPVSSTIELIGNSRAFSFWRTDASSGIKSPYSSTNGNTTVTEFSANENVGVAIEDRYASLILRTPVPKRSMIPSRKKRFAIIGFLNTETQPARYPSSDIP